MTPISLVWITPNAEQLLGSIARVSNPSNQSNPNVSKLLAYMIEHEHWSPFEMASMCIEINTTRDIGRQILRHRSFSFQEFSQRYADASQLGDMVLRECRLQDNNNRQNSLATENTLSINAWADAQRQVGEATLSTYNKALKFGIAKEVARAVLPEGMTPSRMYMTGTIRSWMHYLKSRLHESTQKEHREIAEDVRSIFREQLPIVYDAFFVAPAEKREDLLLAFDKALRTDDRPSKLRSLFAEALDL